jgi:hypothetical protein
MTPPRQETRGEMDAGGEPYFLTRCLSCVHLCHLPATADASEFQRGKPYEENISRLISKGPPKILRNYLGDSGFDHQDPATVPNPTLTCPLLPKVLLLLSVVVVIVPGILSFSSKFSGSTGT